ncbi:MAG: outer membrane protein assembly factor BamB family protein [Armatimonadota bacterium]
MIRLRISLLAILTVALAVASTAGPWTGGRGPGNQGIFPDVNFPSNPAVVWKAFLGSEYQNLNPSNTLVAGNSVIVAYDKRLLALSTDTGQPQWITPLYDPPLGEMLLLNGKIILSTQHGNVLAFDPATGEQVWKCRLTDGLRNGPVLLDKMLLYTTKSNTIEALDLSDSGAVKQSTIIIRAPNKIEAAPVALGKKSYLLAYSDGTLMRLEDNGINRWSIKLPNTVLGLTPVTNGSVVIVTTANGIYCVNPFIRESDKPIRWSFPCPDRAPEAAILSGNRVYVATRDGKLHALDLANGKDVWTHKEYKGAESTDEPGLKLPAAPVAQPILVGENLLVRMEHGLIALFQKDSGNIVWLYKMMPPVGVDIPRRFFAGGIAIDGNDIYFAGTDTYIYRLSKSALDTDPPTFAWMLPVNSDKGYVTADKLPYVGAVISDEGSGLHSGLVEMKLDGTDLTKRVQHDAPTGYYFATLSGAPLEQGLHRLTVTAKDYRGNIGTLNQSFIVANTNADFVEIQIGGEFIPKVLPVRPGTVISWRNVAGGARTVASDSADELLRFSSDTAYPDGIPDKERWVWIVPEDIEPDTTIFYHCRLFGKPGDGETLGDGLVGMLQVVEGNPITYSTTPAGGPPVVPGAGRMMPK